ncbi:MAG TPA: chitobiase/beta-hexosaminidase C-terminal domain-containing protein [Chitinophagaceae bacterium]|nr:chitobiase/beta-hexosaminidase C-terminal domain-containing protein [Chitinophagaceae bacterium]
MKLFQRILSSLSFFIIVMLLFLLFFQNKVSLPPSIQAVGRMHPLLLHLPIGLLVISFILWIGKKNIEASSFQKIFILVLQVTAFTASLTALMGFFLSREGGYDENILLKHKVLGIITAILSYALLLIYQADPEKKFLFGTAVTLSLIVMVIGSHFGSTLTHGEGFVWQPLQGEEEIEEQRITDSSSLFAAAVRPILKSKCFSCHNERKAKGELIMTTEEKILEGGKNGPIWKSGDALNSHIIQNIDLPEEDKKHMPPKGKPQLSQDERDFLFAWIQSGADMKRPLKSYSDDDTLKILASRFVHLPDEQIEKEYLFAAAPFSLLEKLSGAFCSVFPLSQYSPALQADFFVREKFDRSKLDELSKVKEQLVVLNLGNMPVTDADMKTINQFTNLEKLILNNSAITNSGLNEIKKLKRLRSLSLAGTKVDKNAAESFLQLDSLKEVFIWNTNISPAEAEELQKQYKRIVFNRGYVPDDSEILTLTPPAIKNEEFILNANETIDLKHQVPGVTIRYTTDGSDPDSTSSPVYSKPISTNGFTMIKARAVRTGWYSSPTAAFSFFKKGLRPTRAELINQPNEKYRGEGAVTLTDLKKGLAESHGDATWLGFREKPFAAFFYFDTAQTVSSISISYNKSIQAYLMPPLEIEIWGGDNKNKLKLLKKAFPNQPTKEEKDAVIVEGIKLDIDPSAYKCFKIIAKNVTKLPAWHPGKGDKGWLFIDEIFFN